MLRNKTPDPFILGVIQFSITLPDPGVSAQWLSFFDPPSGSIVRSTVDPSVKRTVNIPVIGSFKTGLIYAATNGGGIYAGPFAPNLNWQQVFTHPTSAAVTDIEIDPAEPEVVYVSFNGMGTRRIYRLKRSSPTPVALTGADITADLPTIKSMWRW